VNEEAHGQEGHEEGDVGSEGWRQDHVCSEEHEFDEDRSGPQVDGQAGSGSEEVTIGS